MSFWELVIFVLGLACPRTGILPFFTDRALAFYNQTHSAKVALPQEPEFSDFYEPSEQQKNGELLFIGGSMLAIGYAAFRFL